MIPRGWFRSHEGIFGAASESERALQSALRYCNMDFHISEGHVPSFAMFAPFSKLYASISLCC